MDKKVPIRTCVVCRTAKPKKELLRIVKTQDGIIPDESGRANGRGAYICRSAECAEKMRKQKTLNKVFSCAVPSEVYDSIAEVVSGKDQG